MSRWRRQLNRRHANARHRAFFRDVDLILSKGEYADFQAMLGSPPRVIRELARAIAERNFRRALVQHGKESNLERVLDGPLFPELIFPSKQNITLPDLNMSPERSSVPSLVVPHDDAPGYVPPSADALAELARGLESAKTEPIVYLGDLLGSEPTFRPALSFVAPVEFTEAKRRVTQHFRRKRR